MHPIPDLSSVPSLDPLTAQLCQSLLRNRPLGPGEPNAPVAAVTKASREWAACAGRDGGGRGAGGGGKAGVDRGEADLPRTGDPPGRPPLAGFRGAGMRPGPGCRGLAVANRQCRMHGGVAQTEAAALAPFKAGIAQALMARGMVPAGRRAVRDAGVRNDPIGGSALGGGGSVLGVGEQRPYTRPDGAGDDVAVRAARRAVRIGPPRNDPMGGRATGDGTPRSAPVSNTLYAAGPNG